MEKLESNREIQEIPLNLGIGSKTVIEYIKNKSNLIISIAIKIPFYKRNFGSIKVETNGIITVYDEEGNKEKDFSFKKYNEDIEDQIAYELTKNVQFELLEEDLLSIICELEDKGLKDISFSKEANGMNLDVEFYRISNPKRRIISYIEQGSILYEFVDPTMSKVEIEKQIEHIDINIDNIKLWFEGGLLVQNNIINESL